MTTTPETAAPLAGRDMAALYRDRDLRVGLCARLCRDRELPGVSTIDVPRTVTTDEQAALAIIRSRRLEETHREGVAEARRAP